MQSTKTLKRASRKLTKAEAKSVRAVTPRSDSIASKLIEAVGKLGDQPELRTLSAVLFAAGLVTSNRRLSRAGVRMFVAHEIATALKDVIKTRVDRTRPRAAKSHAERKPKLGDSTAKEETSFPSGHSAGSTAVALAFSRQFPEHRVPALAAAAMVSGAQVPRCAHYPTDVLGGVALGAISEAVGDFVSRLVVGAIAERPSILEAQQPLPPRA